MMTNDEKVQYWIEISDDDVETTEVLLNGKRYLFMCFTCHLLTEKIFKAYYAKVTEQTPPFTHDLRYLASHTDLWDDLTELQKDLVDNLALYNIKGRYPEYRSRIASVLTQATCQDIFNQTKALQLWIKEKISLQK
jgi:HEPN domain-containing protein